MKRIASTHLLVPWKNAGNNYRNMRFWMLKKRAAWHAIADKMNVVGGYNRDVMQILKIGQIWSRLQNRRHQKKKREGQHTGGEGAERYIWNKLRNCCTVKAVSTTLTQKKKYERYLIGKSNSSKSMRIVM